VALRSALLIADRALAYAGAGLVRGSSPADEWAETEHKLRAIRAALCVRRATPASAVSAGTAARLAAEALLRALVGRRRRARRALPRLAQRSRWSWRWTACTARARPVRLHTILDERAAAFFALGLARVSGQPDALLHAPPGVRAPTRCQPSSRPTARPCRCSS
jgi:hypothetical protein